MSPKLSKSLEHLGELERAIYFRNEHAMYVAMAKLMGHFSGEKIIDIAKVRACARVYASQLFGWEIG